MARLLLRRRDVLGLAPALALGACRKASPPKDRSPRWEVVEFPPDALSPEGQRAELFKPLDDAGEAAPRGLLVALHGRGESGRGLAVGAAGWRDDYGVEAVHERLRAPPLTRADFKGFVTEQRLRAINAGLAAAPFRGLDLACPYTPDLTDRSLGGARPFAEFITTRLIPSASSRLGSPLPRQRVGIDGVSMGGRLALLVGLSNPGVFGSVGALQPAIRVGEADAIADLAARAVASSPLRLRLVSSEGDPFLPAVTALAAALGARNLEHDVIVTPGPHDYVYNRGPGGVEMLLFHERAARGLPSI